MAKRRTRSEAGKPSSSKDAVGRLQQTLKDGSSKVEPAQRTLPAVIKIPGGAISFSWGREHYQPIQFHGFDVGPFEITTPINGEVDIVRVQAGVMDVLDGIAKREFERKRVEYLARVKDLDEFMEAYALRNR